jgi:hypothetical protein
MAAGDNLSCRFFSALHPHLAPKPPPPASQSALNADPKQGTHMVNSGTRSAAHLDSNWSTFGHTVIRTATICLQAGQFVLPELLKKMTKVIPPVSDEMGGCKNAYPAFADSHQRPTSELDRSKKF